MTFSLADAVVYDIETFPNVFTLHAEMLHSDTAATWEISHRRDDRQGLIHWFNYLRQRQAPMIGFFSLSFDYTVIHQLFMNPSLRVEQIYAIAQELINNKSPFGKTIFESERFTPQIDLHKIHHFDNKAKTTSLKALQIAMRSPTVVDTPVPFGTVLTPEQTDAHIIPYNRHDVKETKRFALYSLENINFRIEMMDQISGDVLNFNDTKIGAKLLEQRLGEDVCYDRSSGRKVPRQTVRTRIALADIIFPYIRFDNPEFNRVLTWMKTQVLTPEDLDDPDAQIKTKGVFTGVKANVGGIDFYFGTGGIHGSVPPQRVIASDEWLIRDIDVAALYPSIAIVNKLAPEHLGQAFVVEYAKLPIERAKYKKGTSRNASLKLGSNGVYGHSNNPFSIFYDPKFPMTITINGQLMLCMLAEWLLRVPTLQIIQINTDGITYRIHRDYEPQAKEVCKAWEAFTCLTLEDTNYSRMFIRDVNNYIAEDTKGKLKQKGAYWHPDPLNYAESISKASPSSWYKDLGNIVSIRAAIAYMTQGIDPDVFIRCHSDPFDFMCRAKVDRGSELRLGGKPMQRITRYYVSTDGQAMTKHSPPPKGASIGEFKRRNGISDTEYRRVLETLAPGTWDERIHTKNRSKYEIRDTQIEAGWKITECNDASHFRFSNVDYRWYIEETRKLII